MTSPPSKPPRPNPDLRAPGKHYERSLLASTTSGAAARSSDDRRAYFMGSRASALPVGSHEDPLEKAADVMAARALDAPRAELTGERAPSAHGPASRAAGLGSGERLDARARSHFEARFGAAFDDVRVHTSPEAAASAHALGASAYTAGADIVFARGAYAPGTHAGDRLLAHELAHVVQQGAIAPRIQRNPPPTTKTPTTTTPTPASIYATALASLATIDPTLHGYLSKAPLGGGSKRVRTETESDTTTSPPTTIEFNFDLEVTLNASMSQEAKFNLPAPSGISMTTKGSATVVTLAPTIEVNPSTSGTSTSAALAQTLYHEGIHFLLFMDDFVPKGTRSSHKASYDNYTKIAKAHASYATLLKDLEAYFTANLKKGATLDAAKAAKEFMTHLVEEKYAFDQEAKKFTKAGSNGSIALTYLMEGLREFNVAGTTSTPDVVAMAKTMTTILDDIDSKVAAAATPTTTPTTGTPPTKSTPPPKP